MEPQQADALVSTVLGAVGGVAGIVSAYVAWHERRTSQRQARIAAEEVYAAWIGAVRSWASEAVDVLADARYSAAYQLTDERRLALTRSLSALADRGRFFFPNLPYPGVPELSKPLANRGSRHAVLDPLIASIRVLEGTLGKHPSPTEAIGAMQREFVSRAQLILRPAETNRAIARIVEEARDTKSSDPTLGGLLETHHAPGADALLGVDRAA